MRLAIVLDGINVGGISRVASDYSRLFLESGCEVSVINLNPRKKSMLSEFPDGCRFFDVSYPRKLAPEQYTQLVKMGNFGKLALPLIFFPLTAANAAYRLFFRAFNIIPGHYDIAIAFSGHFNDLSFVAGNFLSADKKVCWVHGALYRFLLVSDGFANLYNKIKNLVVLADDSQKEALFANNRLKLNIHKLYNPTFLSERPADDNKVNELKKKYGKFLLMVARFSYPEKDHYTVCRALDILRTRYSCDDLSLVFVGEGNEEEKVRAYVEQLGAETAGHIYFEGVRNDVQNYYKAAELLVHASVSGEGLPTVMIEAMIYGLPMVVTDSKVGPREILGNDEFGLLCNVQDPEDMAAKIRKLLSDSELYAHYIEKEKERLPAFYPETISEQVLKVFDELV